MSRRRRQARPSNLIVGFAAVGGAGLAFHFVSSQGDSGDYLQPFTMFIGQLMLCICISAAVFLLHHYMTREQKAKAMARLRAHDVDNMTGKEFEVFLGTVLTARGYTVKKIAHSQDGGVDIIARKDKATYSIQAKRYKAGKKADRRRRRGH